MYYSGITVEVNLHKENEKHFIKIVTLPYSVPISLRGRYYYRSGSVKQELEGTSLNEFLLKRADQTWDDDFTIRFQETGNGRRQYNSGIG